MTSPALLHRHQSSLEGVINFSAATPLSDGQRASARQRFYCITDHFGAHNGNQDTQYSAPRLVRLTYEHALSEPSRDNFLRAFFQAMVLSIEGPGAEAEAEAGDYEDLRSPFFAFADYLLDNFFLPLKASTRRTPQPSPAFHSAIERVQAGGVQDFTGTPDRVSALRGACLIRDRHRCVITRSFDMAEATNRMRIARSDSALDDDGTLLQEHDSFGVLEVAHILPHSLMKTDVGSELSPSKQAALAILNMLDDGVVHLIEGTAIDRPRNALTLTHGMHLLFGDFLVFFEPVCHTNPHTYRIGSFLPEIIQRNQSLPVTRTLYLSHNQTIDPPSPRLLALHRAIAYILHLSAAGEYIDKLLRDMDGQGILADGSTELDRLVRLGLRGWSGNEVC
ncbi:hypothetical protein RRF57_011354 [Xylaria bambusicola]|uniref:HNH nuclease domain-containing protein n=1 Tax=Xylaria bambusicola TaxID=326684 RepID=A0AAN7Z9Q2_9PEZI